MKQGKHITRGGSASKGTDVKLLDDTSLQLILDCTGARGVKSVEPVQSLWSGYGQILRVMLIPAHSVTGKAITSVVVKHVNPPDNTSHPRGWHSDNSTLRKLESYRVESHWYTHYASLCPDYCAIPQLLAHRNEHRETWLVLQDLDTHFPSRHTRLSLSTCVVCLQWLARFHAFHLQHAGEGLWSVGTYWHLQTRQDEFHAMSDSPLKEAAAALNSRLNGCQYKTLVHGDAKVANMCFSENAQRVALVDFQYTGKGCGMCDVAYFLGSCLDGSECEQHAQLLLDRYFLELTIHLPIPLRHPVEQEWRDLYAVAWADFHRFLAGWMPDHPKINAYSNAMTAQALAQL